MNYYTFLFRLNFKSRSHLYFDVYQCRVNVGWVLPEEETSLFSQKTYRIRRRIQGEYSYLLTFNVAINSGGSRYCYKRGPTDNLRGDPFQSCFIVIPYTTKFSPQKDQGPPCPPTTSNSGQKHVQITLYRHARSRFKQFYIVVVRWLVNFLLKDYKDFQHILCIKNFKGSIRNSDILFSYRQEQEDAILLLENPSFCLFFHELYALYKSYYPGLRFVCSPISSYARRLMILPILNFHIIHFDF